VLGQRDDGPQGQQGVETNGGGGKPKGRSQLIEDGFTFPLLSSLSPCPSLRHSPLIPPTPPLPLCLPPTSTLFPSSSPALFLSPCTTNCFTPQTPNKITHHIPSTHIPPALRLPAPLFFFDPFPPSRLSLPNILPSCFLLLPPLFTPYSSLFFSLRRPQGVLRIFLPRNCPAEGA